MCLQHYGSLPYRREDNAVTNPDTTDDDGRHSAQGDKQTEVPIDPRDYEQDDDE